MQYLYANICKGPSKIRSDAAQEDERVSARRPLLLFASYALAVAISSFILFSRFAALTLAS